MRGIQTDARFPRDETGITPACAGNTLFITAALICRRDHPRVCGEYRSGRRSCLAGTGSPPRVRGIRVSVERGDAIRRITPACAGNTGIFFQEMLAPRDHPRVCGEYCLRLMELDSWWGSPPRVRGIRILFCMDGDLSGITPACAGNTQR